MCQRSLFVGLAGFGAGVLLLAAGLWLGASRLMLVERESPLGVDDTVAALSAAAAELDWAVPKVYRLCEGLAQHGHRVRPVAVVELCKPDYAAEILKVDHARVVSSMMPCRISVYERADGGVLLSRLNTELMGRLFPAPVSEVMARASADTRRIIERALGEPSPTAQTVHVAGAPLAAAR